MEGEEPAPDSVETPASARPNLLVRGSPFLTKGATRVFAEVEKETPLSAILDATVPVVALETDRLQQAIAWLYDAVSDLKKQDSQFSSNLVRIEGTLKQWGTGQAAAGPGAAATPEGEALLQRSQRPPDLQSQATPASDPAGMQQTPLYTYPEAGEVGQLLGRVERDIRRLVRQEEQKRIAEEKLLEMRIDSLQSDLGSRLVRNDLEEFKVQMNERFQQLESREREDVAQMGNLLNGESAAERRRLQMQFEGLRTKAAGQLEETEKLMQSTTERSNETMQQLEERVSMLEGGRGAGDAGRPDGIDSRLRSLESLCQKLAGSGSLVATAHDGGDGLDGGAAVESDVAAAPVGWQAALEARMDALESYGSMAEIRRQLVDLHRAHTEAHQQHLELGSRLSRLEEGGPALSSGLPSPSGAGGTGESEGGGALQQQLQSLRAEMREVLDKAERRQGEREQRQREGTMRVRRVVELMAKYIAGINLGDGGRGSVAVADSTAPASAPATAPASAPAATAPKGRPASPAAEALAPSQAEGSALVAATEDGASAALATSPPQEDREDPLEVFERKAKSSFSGKQGSNLDLRLRSVEKNAPADSGERLVEVEKVIKKLDVDTLGRVPPTLVEYRREQQAFNEDTHKAVQELKCLVGCLEACVPQETRKAIALFKRAAGADVPPASPREFELQSKILLLRDDVQVRLANAESKVSDQCEHVVQIVKGLERQHGLLKEDLERLRLGEAPAAGADASPSGSSPGGGSGAEKPPHVAAAPPPGWEAKQGGATPA